MTKVTGNDYNLITKTFTEEEIREKYGRLEIMSKEEYKEYKNRLKRHKRIKRIKQMR